MLSNFHFTVSHCIFNTLRLAQLTWSTSPPMSYHNFPTLLYPTVFVHSSPPPPYVLVLQSPYTSLPNCLCPFFQHTQTIFLCVPTLGDLSTHQKTFYSSVSRLHIHRKIIMSFLSSFAKSSSFTAQVPLP